MKTIHPLPELLVAKIAAGEVIERPSFAVKEILENALDAGATNIMIHLEDAGLSIVRITDNGCGMSQEDVMESWKPHTTSKISDEEDLTSIRSFGFRGEALSSLASVSALTIQSRQGHSATGYEITIDNGVLKKSAQKGMPTGTIITVERLFGKVPARKKFLKSQRTELRLIMDVVTNVALSNPGVQLTLTHGRKTLIYYPETTNLMERAEQVFGLDTFPLYIPFKKEETYIKVSGYIAKPQLTSSTHQKQHVFINSRPVTDKLISTSVKEAYGTMLESGTYPLFALFLTLPVELVDANIHPRKEQVRFSDGPYVFQTVKQCITEVLNDHNLTFRNLSWSKSGAGMTRSYAGTVLKETVLEKETFTTHVDTEYLQFRNTYIIITTKSSVYLMDQHAAHERILFEKLKSEFLRKQSSAPSVRLNKPVPLQISPRERLQLKEFGKHLKTLGFRFRNGAMTHVSALFQDRDGTQLIRDVLETLEHTGTMHSIDAISEEMLAFLACRAAVKAGDPLTKEQMSHIHVGLLDTPNNSTCPHGRPTRIIMTLQELNTMFHR